MRRTRAVSPASTFEDSDGTDVDTCFDEEDKATTSDTDTDVDTNLDEKADELFFIDEDEDNDHPPEYYVRQEDEFDESDIDEDYAESSCTLLDYIEGRFAQYCKYTNRDPKQTLRDIQLCIVKSFFDWLCNQRRGKGGRRVQGVRSANTFGTYWKIFRLVYERETGEKIPGKFNRQARRVLRKLAKKHKLKTAKREKTAMYVEDLAEYLQTNLTTTKKRYTHGRQRIQLALFCQLAGFSGNRPQALLKLRYRDIIVTLLRDPNGGPHRILIEFTCEFTKQFLGPKETMKFVLPEIIFDPSLILSPHVFLLGLIFADKAFAATNLTSSTMLSKLYIPPGRQQLPLHFKSSMLDVPVFRKTIKSGFGYEISPSEPLTYACLLAWMKIVGLILGLLEPTRPYCLRYNAGNEFNQSKHVSDALQNIMLQHADIGTFIKHYLPRRSADVRAIVSGYEPQKDLMRAASRMTRWIDPERPQSLTLEQSQSVDENPRLRRLLAKRATWNLRYKGTATKQPGYATLSREIINMRQRLRVELLRQTREKWDVENSVNEIELQLSGLKFSEALENKVEELPEMPTIQKRLIETVMTLPGTTIEEEFCRRNAAIDAVTAYCHFQEGGAVALPRRRVPASQTKEVCAQLSVADAEKEALEAAMLHVFKENRPTICFKCLGEENLPFQKRVYSFATPGDLTKHFKRKHLSNIRNGDEIQCKVCQMSLEHKMHLQNHAALIHGTVS